MKRNKIYLWILFLVVRAYMKALGTTKEHKHLGICICVHCLYHLSLLKCFVNTFPLLSSEVCFARPSPSPFRPQVIWCIKGVVVWMWNGVKLPPWSHWEAGLEVFSLAHLLSFISAFWLLSSMMNTTNPKFCCQTFSMMSSIWPNCGPSKFFLHK